ncbi:MAG: hypothetical protein Q8N69_01055 [bacterium]|nr:hypothetical protein [bacterium]
MKKWICLAVLLILTLSFCGGVQPEPEKIEVSRIVMDQESKITFYVDMGLEIVPFKLRIPVGNFSIYRDVPVNDKMYIVVGFDSEGEMRVFKKHLFNVYPDYLAVKILEIHIRSLSDIEQ